tara:strand:- start:74 stop:406 length:333 start_codon:yes stop_codon:yes gene_type:complete
MKCQNCKRNVGKKGSLAFQFCGNCKFFLKSREIGELIDKEDEIMEEIEEIQVDILRFKKKISERLAKTNYLDKVFFQMLYEGELSKKYSRIDRLCINLLTTRDKLLFTIH